MPQQHSRLLIEALQNTAVAGGRALDFAPEVSQQAAIFVGNLQTAPSQRNGDDVKDTLTARGVIATATGRITAAAG